MDNNLYIGIMSGTSFDGIDAVLVDINDSSIQILGSYSKPYPLAIRNLLFDIAQTDRDHSLEKIYSLDATLGEAYADCALALLDASGFSANQIVAIGSHGQTIRHYPHLTPQFTVQIGDPNRVAAKTGIQTVADFRRADLAHGGQGAPLAPAFHRQFFYSSKENRAVVNIGGFANITFLPADGKVFGFDTGPGNVLLDAWIGKHHQQPFDFNGNWAATGRVNEEMLQACLSHPYFKKSPPKSTGRDEFDDHWLNQMVNRFTDTKQEDVQATLTELTAVNITEGLLQVEQDKRPSSVYLCGGGAYNPFLVSRVAAHLPNVVIQSTDQLGLEPQLVEATMMAWLAYRRVNYQPIDLQEITGSHKPVLMGGVYG